MLVWCRNCVNLYKKYHYALKKTTHHPMALNLKKQNKTKELNIISNNRDDRSTISEFAVFVNIDAFKKWVISF